MTTALRMVLLEVHTDQVRCLVIASRAGVLPNRDIRPVEIVGQFSMRDGEPDLSPASFARGKHFTDFLHESIAKHGPALPGIREAAAGRHDSFVYVIDGRTPTPHGDVPEEDIIGAFRVVHGQVSEQTYQRCMAHRLFTERGFFQLDPRLAELLLGDLEARCGPLSTDASVERKH